MSSDYIYIKFCSNKCMNINNLKVELKDKCNKIVFDGVSNYFGKIKIPICDNEIYKLVIYYDLTIIVVPLVARASEIYCINIDNNTKGKHLVTVLLIDKNYPNIKIEGGNMILCQDTQFR